MQAKAGRFMMLGCNVVTAFYASIFESTHASHILLGHLDIPYRAAIMTTAAAKAGPQFPAQ